MTKPIAKTTKPPFFIIGSPRSGTTLLRLMLHAHPHFIVPPECAFGVWFSDSFGDFNLESYENGELENFLDKLKDAKKWELWNVDVKDVKAMLVNEKPTTYAGVFDAIYRLYASKYDKPITRWGDKNNYYLHRLPRLLELFPEAQFIHIVRDGRAVAADYIDLSKRNMDSPYAPNLPSEIPEIATEWCENVGKVDTFFANQGNDKKFMTVRFEDIVLEPEKTLKGCAEFLGEEYSQNMLRYAEMDAESGKEPADFNQWKEKNNQPLDPSEVDRFARELSEGQIGEFENLSKKWLERFGYL